MNWRRCLPPPARGHPSAMKRMITKVRKFSPSWLLALLDFYLRRTPNKAYTVGELNYNSLSSSKNHIFEDDEGHVGAPADRTSVVLKFISCSIEKSEPLSKQTELSIVLMYVLSLAHNIAAGHSFITISFRSVLFSSSFSRTRI